MAYLKRGERQMVRLLLNGRAAGAMAEPRRLLSDFLRHDLGATGTHVGCEHGICGACTVRVDGEAVRACLIYAVQVDGLRVDTVEGLVRPDGSLNRLQEAFRRHHALQCGFCTAGILNALTALFERQPRPLEATIREVLAGHLCRCTGYAPILRAALDVAGGDSE